MATQIEITNHCIKGIPYKGYVSPFCGDGTVVFHGPSGDEVRGHSESRDAWLEPAWLQAKGEIDLRTSLAESMTEIEQRAVKLLRDSGGEFCGTAALGFALWPEGSVNRTPQGMALAAGRVMSGLTHKGLVRQFTRGKLTVFRLK